MPLNRAVWPEDQVQAVLECVVRDSASEKFTKGSPQHGR